MMEASTATSSDELMLVNVPDNVRPGEDMVVMTPSGQQYKVVVPPGAGPGSQFKIAVPRSDQMSQPKRARTNDDAPQIPHSQVRGSQGATYSFSALLTLLSATHALACTMRLAPFACLRPHTIRVSVCALCLAAHTIHKAPRQQQNPPAKGKERKRNRVRISCNMHLPCPHTHPAAIAREHLFARSRSASRCASSLEKSTLEFGHITSLQCSLHLDLGHIISHTHWKAENFPTV